MEPNQIPARGSGDEELLGLSPAGRKEERLGLEEPTVPGSSRTKFRV